MSCFQYWEWRGFQLHLPLNGVLLYSFSQDLICLRCTEDASVEFQLIISHTSFIIQCSIAGMSNTVPGGPQPWLLRFLQRVYCAQVCIRCILHIENTSGFFQASSVLSVFEFWTELWLLMTLHKNLRMQNRLRTHIEKQK